MMQRELVIPQRVQGFLQRLYCVSVSEGQVGAEQSRIVPSLQPNIVGQSEDVWERLSSTIRSWTQSRSSWCIQVHVCEH